jgi:TetR/AcrR family transcriptional regulator of autoinduction and epiphytic fitness
MSTIQTTDSARQQHVLSVALDVFGRYGFRKTSMDDLARAAEISRQGLYFYFESKEALFRAAVRQVFDTALTEASECLDDPSLAIEGRVVGALDAWFGRYIGSPIAPDGGSLLDNSAMQLGDLIAEFSAAFEELLRATIAATTLENDRRQLGITPEEIAGMLTTLGGGWKRSVASRSEFVDKVTGAVRLVFAALISNTSASQ